MGDLAAPARSTAARYALVAAILGSSMAFVDGTAVNVALPVLQRDFGASSQSVQWVVEGYSLFLSALILIGGGLGDLFGRRAIFAAGVALFALASLACAFAPNVDLLVAARCVQGMGGALATPGSLALISASYSGAARGRAIGTWSGFSAITGAFGPLLGGWLVQSASWRFVFLINVPIAVLTLALTARAPESRDPDATRTVDVIGAALATLGLGGVVYGLIAVQSGGGPLAFGTIAAGALALVAFIVWEARTSHPMMRLDIFGSRTFSAANAYTFLLYAALGGSFYFIPFDLINVQGYPPAAAGAALLPMIAIMSGASRWSGGLVSRTGPRIPLVIGALLASAAFFAFGSVGIGHSYWTTFFPAAVLFGIGGAFFVAPLTTVVMDAVDGSHSGIASGVNNAISRTAGLVAIAAFGIVLAAAFDAQYARDISCGKCVQSPALHALFVEEKSELQAGRGYEKFDAHAISPETVHAIVKQASAAGFAAVMRASGTIAILAAILAFFAFSRGRASTDTTAPRAMPAAPAIGRASP
jgi:EmrB/QacA subfamily drug resistance transporter